MAGSEKKPPAPRTSLSELLATVEALRQEINDVRTQIRAADPDEAAGLKASLAALREELIAAKAELAATKKAADPSPADPPTPLAPANPSPPPAATPPKPYRPYDPRTWS